MESADSLATFQYEVAKNEFIKFCKSKDFENLSVKEKKEVLVERINSSYFIKNLYNLFALSYERLLKKNDSAFSNLDTFVKSAGLFSLQEITDNQFVLMNAEKKEGMLYVRNLKNIVFCAEQKHKVLFVWVQNAEKHIIKFILGRNKEPRTILEQVKKNI